MASRKQSLEKLSAIFEERKSNETDMAFRNMFACACYLSMLGQNEAGRKQLISLFDWLGWGKRKTYFRAILDSFTEYAPEYASEISANHEINKVISGFEPAPR
ncbi:MAG TPA: hypothetical protein VF275_03485 [Gammaproteobacteria bacterium]